MRPILERLQYMYEVMGTQGWIDHKVGVNSAKGAFLGYCPDWFVSMRKF